MRPSPTYDDGHQTILRSALTNQLPDVFYSGFHLLPELVRTLAKREQVVALDDLLAGEGAEFKQGKLFRRAARPRHVDRKLYGIAFNASQPDRLLQRRPGEKGGLSPRTFPQTTRASSTRQAGSTTRANGINGMAYDVHGWPDSWLFEAMITQSGGRLLDRR